MAPMLALVICLFLVLASYSDAADHHDASYLASQPEEVSIEALLPEGVSLEEAERMAGEALSAVFQNLIASKSAENQKGQRSLSSGFECNTLIDTVTKENLMDVYKEVLGEQIPDEYYPSAVLFATQAILNFKMEYALYIYKVCGRCSELVEDYGYEGKGSCQEDDYGYDAMNSGILIAPYEMETGQIVKGTLPVKLYSTAGGFTPTTGWDRSNSNHDPFVILGTVISSATRSFVLIPDYLGFGESQDYYRTFLNRRAVASSTVALVWASEMLISRETNCASSMSDSYGLFGYSEGAHASVSAADALHRLGKTIIAVHAGGGGYRVSSAVVKRAVEYCSFGATWFRFFIALIGAQFHNTVTDMANYNTGQYWYANDTVAKPLIAAAQIAASDRTLIYSLIPGDPEGSLAIFNPDLLDLFVEGIEQDIADPCVTLANNRTDKICQSLQDQDLVEILEAAPYPVHLCHSAIDQVIAYDNLPNIGANPNLRLSTKQGTHSNTFGYCLFDYIRFILNDKNFKNYPVAEKAWQNGCDAPLVSRVHAAAHEPEGRCFFLFDMFGMC